jgi:hypothetical protein
MMPRRIRRNRRTRDPRLELVEIPLPIVADEVDRRFTRKHRPPVFAGVARYRFRALTTLLCAQVTLSPSKGENGTAVSGALRQAG